MIATRSTRFAGNSRAEYRQRLAATLSGESCVIRPMTWPTSPKVKRHETNRLGTVGKTKGGGI